MAKSFEDFQPIFGEAKAEWESTQASVHPHPLLPFLFHVHALDSSRLRIHVSDFHSYTWESIRTVQHLEDLRDVIGVGGSWSEFIDYLIASMSSDGVKLVLGALPNSNSDSGATSGKLMAHKSKGMPLISIPLNRLTNSSANDAMANLSMELFKAFKSKHNEVVKEQQRLYRLTVTLAAEQDKNESIQNQLDAVKRKQPKLHASDKAFPISGSVDNFDTMSVSDTQQSSETLSTQSPQSVHRVVPAYRRAKVRGALLQDTEDNNAG
ncbi:uncharacterized protein LOC131242642 isoform X2 [Magnolia sinica]|uniref:uncharacterized protein LOC131242642 isoform X2 n=1 Tax=Magnolia sinica TaxID=86752 RepID=UPI002659EB9D|nr:uncharacterized protein LOC131242642 isoform X2 [Magnolia sinica]